MALISDLLHPNELSLSLLTLLLLLIFTLSWYSWNKQRTSLLLLPPGPRGVPLFGNLLSLDPELHSYFAGLAQIHGPIYKLRLGYKLGIVVTSPSLTREVLKDHDVTFANRDVPEAGRVATYGGSDIVWTPYGPEWRMLRKVCVIKMLSNTTLDSVYELRRKQVRETVGHFYRRVGSPVNIGEQMFLTVMNVITNMMWGGTVEGDERSSLGADFREVVSEMTELLGKPNISDFYPGLARFDLQGIKKQMDGLAKRFDRIFDVMINQRLKIDKGGGSKDNDKDSKDFLQFLLKLKDEGDSKTPMTMIQLKALLMQLVELKAQNRVQGHSIVAQFQHYTCPTQSHPPQAKSPNSILDFGAKIRNASQFIISNLGFNLEPLLLLLTLFLNNVQFLRSARRNQNPNFLWLKVLLLLNPLTLPRTVQ
ncbi:cytochrome P450 736A117 isoform X2 [Quercus suber]|uniref:cytochrome P450 736A117 isoform X2 n=1 Tax=Quercus suber TaxID=58331 RepID=UPI000CE2591C|nr:cytochrome P450 76M5-like isoform X2 [Quercus suber]